MKKILILILLLNLTTGLAQKITGKVINEFDNTPIFGVTIYSDGVPFAFSDQEGEFEIEHISKIKELLNMILGTKTPSIISICK